MATIIVNSTVTKDLPNEVAPGTGYGNWIVTVFDNDTNTVEEVVQILLFATHCSNEEAALETWEIHHLGKSVVHHGAERTCREVADVIATIGIRVEVGEE